MLVPLYLYEYYGDGTMLRKHYEAMGRYVDYLTSKADDHILKHGLGDWFDIGPKMPGRAQLSSLAATATPIYYMDALAMVKGAELLGKKKDAERWQKLADAIRTSYNEKFFHKEGCYYDRNSQTANSIALCAGLVDPEYRQGVLDNVVKDIRSRNNGLTGGDVGYTYILRALEAGGRSDVIFDMNSRYDVYGYGYMLAQGATALPESWQVVPIKSHNHFMLGHLMQWLYTPCRRYPPRHGGAGLQTVGHPTRGGGRPDDGARELRVALRADPQRVVEGRRRKLRAASRSSRQYDVDRVAACGRGCRRLREQPARGEGRRNRVPRL